MKLIAVFRKNLHIGLLILAAAIGIYAIYVILQNQETEMRHELTAQIEAIDASLDWTGIEEAAIALSKSDRSDYAKLMYIQTRVEMAKQCQITPKCRGVYLMRQNEKNQIIIMLGSAPESNSLYVEPNTVYEEVTEPLSAAFKTKKSTIDNPARDSYGYWQSAYAPHILTDGSIVVVGFDIEASHWNQTLWSAAAVPALVTLGLLGLLTFFGFMWQSKVKQNEQLLKMQVELFKLSNEDSLTRIPNRRLFEDRLERLLASSERTKEKFTLIYLDLDGFKKVNDTFGHQAGDRLLAVVAERLSMICRIEDTIARLSGDEFAILLPRLDSVADAELIAQKIIKTIAAPVTLLGGEMMVTASLGIALYQGSHMTKDKILQSADVALYKAKNRGKNCYHFADDLDVPVLKKRVIHR